VHLYSAFIVVPHTQGAQYGLHNCYLQITPYLPLPPIRSPDGASTDWGCGHLIAAYYSSIPPKGWKAESAWLADLQRTVYRHKWSPISCMSSAGQGKFAGQRPTFYHRATQPTYAMLVMLMRMIPACYTEYAYDENDDISIWCGVVAGLFATLPVATWMFSLPP